MTTVPLEKRLRPRKTPLQRRATDTRARILDGARDTFATHGYAGGTTNRIADVSGLSVGSLYQYFPNKDAILVELVRLHVVDGMQQVMAALPSDVGPGDDLEPLLRAVITAMVDVHVHDRRLHQVLFEESPRPPSLLAELAEVEDQVVDLVAGFLTALTAGCDDMALPARIVVVTIESLVHRFVATSRPLDPDQFIDETTCLVAGYVERLTA